MNAALDPSALNSVGQAPVATQDPAPSLFSALDAPASQPLVAANQSTVSAPASVGPDGFTRLAILDHPEVAPLSAKIAETWGDLSQLKSSLDTIRFGGDVESNIERFFATMNAQSGNMEAAVFLEVSNALMEGAEANDANLGKIEKEAQEKFQRPFLVKFLSAIGLESMAKKMDKKRMPEVAAFVQSQFKTGGERINAWIDGIREKTEDACRRQIEGIKRWEIAIEEGKKHEIQLAATVSAGYAVIDAATAALSKMNPMDQKDQSDRIDNFRERLTVLSVLYADAPGRMVRSKIGLNASVKTLTTVMSSAMSFFIQLRQSSFDLTQAYQTRAMQQSNAMLSQVSAGLARRSVSVLGEVAKTAVTMAADNAKSQASLLKSLADASQKIVSELKAADKAATEQLKEASKEMAEGQRLMLELREKSGKMA